MICPFCHFNIGDNAELCPYCRISFNKEDIAKIKDSTKFVCPTCGGHKIYYAKGVNYLSSFYNSRDIKYIEPLCAECHTKAEYNVESRYKPERMNTTPTEEQTDTVYDILSNIFWIIISAIRVVGFVIMLNIVIDFILP